MAKRVAVIDIGSNSIRMVVYEKSSRFAFHQLHEEKSRVRISENAYKNGGELQSVPMQRAYDALENFLQISQSFKVKKVLCVATSALRDAPNQKTFLHKVKNNLKLNIKIITGEKEAYFGAIACANLLPRQTQALSIDIGGGSTELSYIDGDSVQDTISLNLGTVRLKELFFDHDDRAGAIEYIDRELDKIANNKISTLIGIGGTFRAISNSIMLQELHPLKKIHAYEYPVETFEKFLEQILTASSREALFSLGIKENRHDVIQPGTLILQRVLHKVKISKIITSGVGVREGVYLSDLLRNTKHKFPHNFNTSIKHLLDAHVLDSSFSQQTTLLSKKIFDLTQEYFDLDVQYRSELATAAKLYPIGSSIHFYSQNKHSYYLIQTALEYGFSHKSITLIATLAKYAKVRLPAESHIEKYVALLPDTKTLNALSYILSLSIALLSHRPRNIDFELQFKNKTLTVVSEENLYITKNVVSKLHTPQKHFKVKFS